MMNETNVHATLVGTHLRRHNNTMSISFSLTKSFELLNLQRKLRQPGFVYVIIVVIFAAVCRS